MYVRDTFYFRDSIEVEEKHTGRYGAPGEKRTKRAKPSPEQIEKQNQWRRERDLRRLIKENFEENDLWVTLTYRKDARPPTLQDAKEDIQKCLRKLREQYKKRGTALKYIVAVEIGSRGGVHHHLIINRIDESDKLLASLWKKGRVHMTLMYKQGGFRDLAEYIAKRPPDKADKWYSRSRNLSIPQAKRQIMLGATFKREPQPPKNYYLEKETYYQGINPVTGHRYRHYIFVRRC